MKGLSNTEAIARRERTIHDVRGHGAALDVRDIPSYGFGHRSLMWWAQWGLILIEGTVFALAAGAYFYLYSHAQRWPPFQQPPELTWGTLNTVLFLASAWPAHAAKHAAEKRELAGVRLWVTVSLLASLIILAVRGLELQHLNCRWDDSAYGSIVWMLIGLHTLHLVTDAYDTAVLGVLMFTGPLEGKRFVDVSENSLYWYFVVLSWLPVYAVLYLAPRGG